MCDFICLENIKSLIDYLVTKHLSKKNPSLEDIANPYVGTFKQLRKAYDENNNKPEQLSILGSSYQGSSEASMNGSHDGGLLMNGRGRSMLSKKALEDQVSRYYPCCDIVFFSLHCVVETELMSNNCWYSVNFVKPTKMILTSMTTTMMMKMQRG